MNDSFFRPSLDRTKMQQHQCSRCKKLTGGAERLALDDELCWNCANHLQLMDAIKELGAAITAAVKPRDMPRKGRDG